MGFSFDISTGIIRGAQKVVIYGPEGIGKSTFSAKFPNPLFIDTEGSTKLLDVRRLPRPTSWEMLGQMVDEVARNVNICKTLVIDTADWAERLCVESVCARGGKNSIEEYGYGKGYVLVKEEFGRLLDKLSAVVERGINVVLTAHSTLRKFERPDESGSYDRWELKLGNKTSGQTSALVKEWADMLLFVNYKELIIEDAKTGKKKAHGGQRMMYTSHSPAFDAKNRHGLKDELPFDYNEIASCIPAETVEALPDDDEYSGVPDALADLLKLDGVSPDEVRSVVAIRGYFPADMKISDYPKDFIDGCLIGTWDKVRGMVEELRKEASQDIPFGNE